MFPTCPAKSIEIDSAKGCMKQAVVRSLSADMYSICLKLIWLMLALGWESENRLMFTVVETFYTRSSCTRQSAS